uniref:Sulfotransferase n=1 Tax=Laticauda laticaudata TaxID=8630 RepID=A0A8C5RUM8_LATLA
MAQKQLSKFLDEKLEENKKATSSELTFMYDGVLYPTMVCCPETLKRVHTFRAREDDIILVSYPKTGKHHSFARNAFVSVHIEYRIIGMEKLPSRRVIRTHLIPQKLPRSFFEKKTKILVLFRNPKDAAVSFFHFTKGINMRPDQNTWDEFFEEFITGKGVLFFLFIGKQYTFLKNSYSLGETLSLPLSSHLLPTNKILFFPFLSLGIVGDWTSVFSESQNEKMDKKFEETVGKTQLGMKLKYEVYCKN